MANSRLEAIGNELLPVIAYGDSVGLPYEARSPQDPYSVVGLVNIENHIVGKHKAGTWSDDTHLSTAVALSLIEEGGFNIDSQAQMHIMALDHVRGEQYEPNLIPPVCDKDDKTGWGKGTIGSIQRIKAGTSPGLSGNLKGAGNGVVMKMAPLVLWQVARKTPAVDAEQQTIDLTKMTHCAPEAVVASLVHREVLSSILTGKTKISDLEELPEFVYDLSRELDLEYDSRNVNSRYFEGLISQKLSREAILAATPKKGFYVPETLVMAYGSLALHHQLPDSMYRAAELGGDSDSVASIVGTMALGLVGEFRKPQDYPELFAYQRLEAVSGRLTTAALKEG